MARYKVAFLDVYEPPAVAEIRRVMPQDFELTAVVTYDEAERLAAVADADVILAGWAPVPAHVIAAAPRLKFIQKWGIGYEKIDVVAAANRGIPVAITAGANAIPVAEHTVMLMLAVYRRLPFVDRELRQGRWLKSEARSFSYQLFGKTVALLGMGHIGRQVAARVRGFEARVIYHDKVRPAPEVEAQLGVSYRPLEQMLEEADIVSLHVPLNAGTRQIINRDALARMKPGAVLINTCRGGVVDEGALIDALRAGLLLGAGLDVFATEPATPDNPLWQMDNVVVSPHSAAATFDNVAQVAGHAFANAARVLRGEPLDPEDVVQV